MKQSITHKPILVAIILLLSVFSVSAQRFVVVGSSRTIEADKVDGHAYKWEVKSGATLLNFRKDGAVYVIDAAGTDICIGGIDPSNTAFRDLDKITIKWPSIGNYEILLTESNIHGCINKAVISVNVVASPIEVSLSSAEYDVVASYGVGNLRKISIPLKFTAVADRTGSLIPEEDKAYNDWKKTYFDKHIIGKYKVNLNYKYYTEGEVSPEKKVSKELSNTDACVFDCNTDYSDDFTTAYNEQLTDITDRYFEFYISSINDIYGAPVQYSVADKYIFGIYKKANITKIQHKK